MAVRRESRFNRTNKELLRKIDDATFAEAYPPEDQHRPLEWKRGFKHIWIEGTVGVVRGWSINEVGIGSLLDDKTLPEVSGKDASAETVLTMEVPLNSIKDMLCVTSEEISPDGEKLLGWHRVHGTMECTVSPSEPYTGEGFDQVYGGQIFEQIEGATSDAALCLALYAPKAALEDLSRSIVKYPEARLRIGVSLLAYRWEVDGLGEWYHSKYVLVDLANNKSAAAFISHIEVFSGTKPSDDASVEDGADENEVEQVAPADPWPERIETLVRAANQVRYALYFMSFVIFIAAIAI